MEVSQDYNPTLNRKKKKKTKSKQKKSDPKQKYVRGEKMKKIMLKVCFETI